MKIANFNGAGGVLKRLQRMSAKQKSRWILKVIAGEALPASSLGLFGLRVVEISLTDHCQCRCGHCFAANNGPDDELGTGVVATLLDELAQLGIMEVCFSGGEPLLHPDLLSLVAIANHKGFLVRLISNGILLDENMVVALKKAGLSLCSVSIDGSTPEVHDTFRGYRGCFNKAVNGLKYLVRHKVPCNIITVARRELLNSGALDDIVKLGADLGVSVVRVNFPVPLGRFQEDASQSLTLAERQEVRKLLSYGNTTMESPRERTTCKAGITKVNVLPNGDVTPCVFVPLPYGNIHKDRFRDIWTKMGCYSSTFKIKGKCPVCDPIMRARIYDAVEAQLKSDEKSALRD